MAAIFLSYRPTDSPQACQVYEWLALRFVKDAVFMDVAAIPYAVDYSDYIREAIEGSRIMIVLIGDTWLLRILLGGEIRIIQGNLSFFSASLSSLIT